MELHVIKKNYNLIEAIRNREFLDSGCGSVGRSVASDARDPRFESSHRQIYFLSAVLKTGLKRRK